MKLAFLLTFLFYMQTTAAFAYLALEVGVLFYRRFCLSWQVLALFLHISK